MMLIQIPLDQQRSKETLDQKQIYFKRIQTKTLEDEFKNKTYKSLFEELRKINHYSKLLHKYGADSKRTWQVMKNITGRQKTKSSLIPHEIEVNKTIIQNQQDITKNFNNSFTSVGQKWVKKVPNVQDFKTSRLFIIA